MDYHFLDIYPAQRLLHQAFARFVIALGIFLKNKNYRSQLRIDRIDEFMLFLYESTGIHYNVNKTKELIRFANAVVDFDIPFDILASYGETDLYFVAKQTLYNESIALDERLPAFKKILKLKKKKDMGSLVRYSLRDTKDVQAVLDKISMDVQDVKRKFRLDPEEGGGMKKYGVVPEKKKCPGNHSEGEFCPQCENTRHKKNDQPPKKDKKDNGS